MGGSGSRAAATADRPAPPPKQQQQVRPDALALSSAHRRSSGPLLLPRYVMFIRRAWSRLRKPAASTTADPYTSPAAIRDAGAQPSTSPSTAAEDNGKAAGGGPSTRATSLMGVVMSSAAEERIQWRRAGRDRRRGWGFRKLKTRSDSAVSSPEGAASLKTATNLTEDVAGALAEGSPSPPTNKPGLSPAAATLDPATVTSATAGADDYACLADDDINWSTGYVKLCCMPDALNQDCSSFQDLRKGPDEYPATTVQSQVVVERLQSVEQRVNLRDGRSVFGETTERICYGRKTTQVGNTSAEQAGELMTFDTSASATTAVLQRSVVVKQKRSRCESLGRQTSTPGIVDEERTILTVSHQQVQATGTTTPGVTAEPIETRRCGSLSPTAPLAGNFCPVGLLIQPHQQQHQQQLQHCWGDGIFSDDNGGGGAAAQRRDSVFNSGSFLYALRHSPPTNFPPPHPPATSDQQQHHHQQFWCGDRGSLENYAARGDFSGEAGAWYSRRHRLHQVPGAEQCSGSAPSSEDDGSAFARRTSASSRRRSGTASFDDGEVADIFMFSDDEDLCAEDLCATGSDHDRPVVAPPMRSGNNHHHFEVNRGSRETAAAAAGQRNLEDGSGDNSARMIELAVRT